MFFDGTNLAKHTSTVLPIEVVRLDTFFGTPCTSYFIRTILYEAQIKFYEQIKINLCIRFLKLGIKKGPILSDFQPIFIHAFL